MALGVQISSFVFVGVPALNDIFGFYKAPSSIQIQRIQITAQTGPVGGNITVTLVNQSGTSLGVTAGVLASGTTYVDTALAAPLTLAQNSIVRAKITGVDTGVASDLVVNLVGATSQGTTSAPSGCGATECQPPSAQLLFFPGTVGPQGPAGPASTVPGPTGPTGAAGAIGVYTGDYVSTTVYYDTDRREDIVSYAGAFWIVNNSVKSGTDTWEAPNVTDWTNVGSTLLNIATGWNLLADQEIPVGVTVVAPGFLQSVNFVANTSGWVATAAGGFQSFDATINGLVSTNTPKFNLADLNRTMPTLGYATYDIPTILDADIPVFPTFTNATDNAMIFFGWTQGANNYIDNRFGNTTQRFQINVQGTGENTSASADVVYIQLYYRTRTSGGAWGAWTAASGQISYMQDLAALPQSFQNTAYLSIGLIGTQDIQFSAGFSKSAAATGEIGGATLTVLAFN